jgi:WD40 repeat protein
VDDTSNYRLRYLDARDGYVRWDRPDGLLVRRVGDDRVLQRIKLPPADCGVTTVRLSRDNRFVSSHHRSRNALTVWQVDGDAPKQLLNQGKVRAAMFAPDRPEIVIYTTANTLLVQPLSGTDKPRTVRVAEISKEPPSRAEWSWECEPGPHRQVAVAGSGRVHVIDLESGKVGATFACPPAVSDLRWSHDGATLAVATGHGSVVLYDAASKTTRLLKGVLSGGPVKVAFDPSGRYLLALNIWTSRQVLVNTLTGALELRFLRGTEPGTRDARAGVGFWLQLPSAVPHHVVAIPPEMGLALPGNCAIHPGGRLLATATIKGLVLSDVATGRFVGLLPAGYYCNAPFFDAAGNLFAAWPQHEGTLPQPSRWPLAVQGTRYQVGAREALALPVGGNLAGSRDGRIVAVSQFNHALALDRQTGKTVKLEALPDARGVAVSPDGALVAAFSWNAPGFRVWQAETGKLIYADPAGYVGHGWFTADGKYLVTAGQGEGAGLRLWSVPDLKLIRKGDVSGVAVALSPDGYLIAIAEAAGAIRLVRLADGDTIASFDAPGNDSLEDINFSPDGRYLVGLNLDRTGYHVWDLGLLRRQLADLKLDWTGQALPPADRVRESIRVEIAK